MKTLFFDGTFQEADLDWLSDWMEAESEDDWLVRNGFHRNPVISDGTYDDWPVCGFRAHEHSSRPEIVVLFPTDGTGCLVCSSHPRLLQWLLTTPMLTVSGVQYQLRCLSATSQAAFRAWHGHDAPLDGLPFEGCKRCDPSGEAVRSRAAQANRRPKRASGTPSPIVPPKVQRASR